MQRVIHQNHPQLVEITKKLLRREREVYVFRIIRLHRVVDVYFRQIYRQKCDMLHQPRETLAYFYSYLSSKKRYSYLQSHVLKVIIHWYGLYYGYIEVLTAKYQRKVGTKKKIYNLTTKQQTVGFKRELDTINYIVIFRIVSVEIFQYF